MFGDRFITTQQVTIPCLRLLVSTATQVSGDTACGSTCLLHLHKAPNCLPLWVPTATYGELHPGSCRVPICLRNLSAHPIEVPAKAIVGWVTPANQVPPVVLPMEASGGSSHGSKKGWILEALNLQGLDEWPEAEHEQIRKLLLKWEHLFAPSDLDLGKTSLIKHQIELTDPVPFKECYWHIPPHMYDDVKAYLQEMLNIGTNRKSHSPWASMVVLVQKKDGSLRFCIDLRKLNNQTIKDAYLLPALIRPLIACRDCNGSPHLTWSLGTGRSRWTRRASHWQHSPWGH